MSRVPILLYHAVADRVDPRFATWSVTPRTFASHLDLLSALGYTTLTVAEFARRAFDGGGPLPPRPVVITFDDGFADFAEVAAPLLAERTMAATVFVTSGCVGGRAEWLDRLGEGARRMMTWDQIAALPAQGIECGGHSLTHRQLDILSLGGAREEITGCKAALEGVLGRVESFAYPHGYRSRRVDQLVSEAGYRTACAVGDAAFRPPGDRWSIPRLIVRDFVTADVLERLLASQRVASGSVLQAAWRTMRRVRAVPA